MKENEDGLYTITDDDLEEMREEYEREVNARIAQQKDLLEVEIIEAESDENEGEEEEQNDDSISN